MLDADFLEPERLRAFVAVAELKNFSRAAERLGLAQPTISIQVRRLEETVGFPLLDRKPSTVELTRDGEIMLAYARELLETIGRARLQFTQPPLEGSVRLGVVEDFNFAALPELLSGLRRRHRRFELFVVMASATDLFEQLRTNSLDLVLAKRLVGDARGEYVCRQKMIWVGNPEILEGDVVPLALTPPNTLTREIVLSALRHAGLRWSIRLEAPTTAVLHAAVVAGIGLTAFGVGVIPSDLLLSAGETGLPPLADAEFTLSVNQGSKDPVVAAFADLLRRMVPMIITRLEEEQTAIIR